MAWSAGLAATASATSSHVIFSADASPAAICFWIGVRSFSGIARTARSAAVSVAFFFASRALR